MAQRKTAKKAKKVTRGDTKWFVHDRFGMFIHWGIYALPARHEWVKNRECMTDEQYQPYFDHFDPDLYDPKLWARMAKEAGMKYFVITTKHHDGFCLWDTKHTDYKVTNTPYGKDLIKPMVKAFRDEGLQVGLYHSLIDWHHDEFPVDNHHPQRDDKGFRKKTSNRDVRKYANYLHNQVRELLTKFGKIDLLFFDFSYPGDDGKGRADWQSDKLIKMCRELQPGICINDRLDLPGRQDYTTPEQYVPAEGLVDENGKPVVWESCQTFSGSWGYHRDETSWKSVAMLIRMLIDHVSRGGNLLLNVGPTGRGQLDQRAIDRLRGMGRWMKLHERAIYGCTYAPKEFKAPNDCRYTYNPKTKRLYVHVYAWPSQHLHLAGLRDHVKYAQLLHDASQVHIGMAGCPGMQLENMDYGKTVVLTLPVIKPDVEVPVIELFLK